MQNRKARNARAFLEYVVIRKSEVALCRTHLGLLVGALALVLGANHGEVLLALLLTGFSLLSLLLSLLVAGGAAALGCVCLTCAAGRGLALGAFGLCLAAGTGTALGRCGSAEQEEGAEEEDVLHDAQFVSNKDKDCLFNEG